MKKLSFAFFALVLLACQTKTDPPVITKPAEQITATKDQSERRKRSELYCEAHHIPIFKGPNSMFSDAEEEVTIRAKDEVVDRALALCYIGVKSEGLEQKYLDKMDKAYGISAHFSPKEKAYVTSAHPTEQQKIDANWRYESLHVMLWSLGFIDSLDYPGQACDVANDVRIIRDLTEAQFRQKAKLRSKQELMDQADLILRIHWACVEAQVKKVPAPAGLDNSVVFERHYSLNWLIKRGGDENWDDVSTDT